MHNTNKSCICDHCGSRFGFEHQLKLHKVIHTQPTFSCSECDNKFLRVYSLNNHKKLHQGILSEICETCNKGYATKIGLYDHIISNHFARLHCEVTGCSSNFNCKKSYKAHLKTMHTKSDQVLIENLLINLEKLMPNFRQFKYV